MVVSPNKYTTESLDWSAYTGQRRNSKGNRKDNGRLGRIEPGTKTRPSREFCRWDHQGRRRRPHQQQRGWLGRFGAQKMRRVWTTCRGGMCSSESSIKESTLSARASSRRGAVWELGEAYLRPRARHSITKWRSKVVSRESTRSAYRKALWVSVDEVAGPKHCRRGLGRTKKRRAARQC